MTDCIESISCNQKSKKKKIVRFISPRIRSDSFALVWEFLKTRIKICCEQKRCLNRCPSEKIRGSLNVQICYRVNNFLAARIFASDANFRVGVGDPLSTYHSLF
jgi:hypothetical protein